MPPSSSLLQGKHMPFTPSPLRLNIFRLFVILSLTQLYRYTPQIFLFSTATFKYKYRAPLRRIGQEYSAKVAFSIFQSLKRILVQFAREFKSLLSTSSTNFKYGGNHLTCQVFCRLHMRSQSGKQNTAQMYPPLLRV